MNSAKCSLPILTGIETQVPSKKVSKMSPRQLVRLYLPARSSEIFANVELQYFTSPSICITIEI